MDDDEVLALSDDELIALSRPSCPRCACPDRLVPIVYGLVAQDDPLVQRTSRGEVDVEFAGCVLPMGPLPVWRCRECDAFVAIDGTQVKEADQ